MKIAVLDDEKQAADTLIAYLRKYEAEKTLDFEISVYNNSESLLEHYDCSYQILFMDIEMTGINGIQAAKIIRDKDEHVAIVFVTNMAQFAIHGYEVGAVDFILKPLTYEKFILKIEKILRRLPGSDEETITLRTSNGIVNLPAMSIMYLEANRNYLYYHAQSGIYKVRDTMSDVEKKLGNSKFSRISNCYIVNMKYITKISAAAVTVGGKELTVSRSKKAEFMQQYLGFMEKV